MPLRIKSSTWTDHYQHLPFILAATDNYESNNANLKIQYMQMHRPSHDMRRRDSFAGQEVTTSRSVTTVVEGDLQEQHPRRESYKMTIKCVITRSKYGGIIGYLTGSLQVLIKSNNLIKPTSMTQSPWQESVLEAAFPCR